MAVVSADNGLMNLQPKGAGGQGKKSAKKSLTKIEDDYKLNLGSDCSPFPPELSSAIPGILCNVTVNLKIGLTRWNPDCFLSGSEMESHQSHVNNNDHPYPYPWQLIEFIPHRSSSCQSRNSFGQLCITESIWKVIQGD